MSMKFKNEINFLNFFWWPNGRRWCKCCSWVNMSNFKHKKGSCYGFKLFSFFLRKYEEKKTRNMLSLMLDLVFKFFCLVFSFIKGYDWGKAIVEDYYTKFVYPILLKCYEHLHHWVNLKMILLTKEFMKIVVWIFLKW
jgi:hypothetical protein